MVLTGNSDEHKVKVYRVKHRNVRYFHSRRAKLDKLQGGGGGRSRASQDLTNANDFLNFYAIKISLFRVSTLSDQKRPTFKNVIQ